MNLHYFAYFINCHEIELQKRHKTANRNLKNRKSKQLQKLSNKQPERQNSHKTTRKKLHQRDKTIEKGLKNPLKVIQKQEIHKRT